VNSWAIYAHEIRSRNSIGSGGFPNGNDYLLYPSSSRWTASLWRIWSNLLGEVFQLNKDEIQGGMELILNGNSRWKASFYRWAPINFWRKKKKFRVGLKFKKRLLVICDLVGSKPKVIGPKSKQSVNLHPLKKYFFCSSDWNQDLINLLASNRKAEKFWIHSFPVDKNGSRVGASTF